MQMCVALSQIAFNQLRGFRCRGRCPLPGLELSNYTAFKLYATRIVKGHKQWYSVRYALGLIAAMSQEEAQKYPFPIITKKYEASTLRI
jgi:hypothetical protein